MNQTKPVEYLSWEDNTDEGFKKVGKTRLNKRAILLLSLLSVTVCVALTAVFSGSTSTAPASFLSTTSTSTNLNVNSNSNTNNNNNDNDNNNKDKNDKEAAKQAIQKFKAQFKPVRQTTRKTKKNQTQQIVSFMQTLQTKKAMTPKKVINTPTKKSPFDMKTYLENKVKVAEYTKAHSNVMDVYGKLNSESIRSNQNKTTFQPKIKSTTTTKSTPYLSESQKKGNYTVEQKKAMVFHKALISTLSDSSVSIEQNYALGIQDLALSELKSFNVVPQRTSSSSSSKNSKSKKNKSFSFDELTEKLVSLANKHNKSKKHH